MDTAWPLLLFLAGLIGFTMLVLVFGLQGEEDADSEGQRSGMPAPARSFFATLGAAFEPVRTVDESELHRVELSVRRRIESAARFVDNPSLDSFHEADDGMPVHAELGRFSLIQGFLARERELVGEFVSDPSLDRLHHQLVRVA